MSDEPVTTYTKTTGKATITAAPHGMVHIEMPGHVYFDLTYRAAQEMAKVLAWEALKSSTGIDTPAK
jgi:hypothetical protein